MATVASVTANPTSVAHGGTSTITAVINNADLTANVTVTVDGSSGSAAITLHETLSLGSGTGAGVVSATATNGTLSGETLVDNGNGTSTFTATFTAS